MEIIILEFSEQQQCFHNQYDITKTNTNGYTPLVIYEDTDDNFNIMYEILNDIKEYRNNQWLSYIQVKGMVEELLKLHSHNINIK